MCGFKPGDEVICIWDRKRRGEPLSEFARLLWRFRDASRAYTVASVVLSTGGAALLLAEVPADPGKAYSAEWFRKVQPRDLSLWLETAAKDTDRLDKGAPARKRERA